MSFSLQPHGLQHARLPCPSLSLTVCSNSCLLSQWCHPTISSCVTPSSPALNLSQHQSLFQWVGSSHQVATIMITNFIFSSVSQSYVTLHDPMDCSTPGFPVHHQLPEFTQTHVYWVSDAIQPSHPLSSPSPAFNLSQHQGLFKWVSSSHQVAKILEFQFQHQSFQWIFRTDFLQDGLVGSSCSPRDSQESSPTLQFKSINSLALNFLYSPTLTSIHDYWKNHSFN